jgi:hypothetical protein
MTYEKLKPTEFEDVVALPPRRMKTMTAKVQTNHQDIEETPMVAAKRKALWDEHKAATDAYIEALKRLVDHTGGIIQNPVNETPESIRQWMNRGVCMANEIRAFENRVHAATRAIIDHVTGEKIEEGSE